MADRIQGLNAPYEGETVKAEDPNRPLDSYFVEELTSMLHEATLTVMHSIERRNEIRRAIDQKHMQVSEATQEADHQFQGALSGGPTEERPRF